MSNDSTARLNEALGQLEDELQHIRSARNQVEGMISSNVDLSASLGRLIDASKELVHESNDQSRDASETLSREANRLAECSKTIEKAAAEGSAAIKEQTSDAQAAIEEAADSAVARIASESEKIALSSKSIESSSVAIAETFDKKAQETQAAIEHAASQAVEKASSEIAGYTEQAISTLSGSLDEVKGGLGSAVEALESESSEAKKSREALLEAHDDAKKEHERQSSETRALIDEAQKHLVEIDARIASLKDVDIDSLVKELRELKDIEASNTEALKKKLTTVTAIAGACIVVCLAALAKLFIG